MDKRALSLNKVIAPLLSVAVGFLIASVVILLLNKNPVLAIYSLFYGAFGTSYTAGATLNLAAILILTGLSALIAFASNIWNTGMEGQLYIGALVTTALVFGFKDSSPFSMPVFVLAGSFAGGCYAAIAGILKVKLKVNEIVSTIMLNYVAMLLVDYACAGPLHMPGAPLHVSPPIPLKFRLGTIPGSPLNFSVLLAILVSIGMFLLVTRTKFGFELRTMGKNPEAAKYVGIRTGSRTMEIMFLSGALSGLAGSMLVLGISFSLLVGISKYYGYYGVAVALLAQLNPLVTLFSGLFFSILNIGGQAMQTVSGVPFEVAQMLAAIIVIAVLLWPVLEKLLVRLSKKGAEGSVR